jgi:hypothetical protein
MLLERALLKPGQGTCLQLYTTDKFEELVRVLSAELRCLRMRHTEAEGEKERKGTEER